MTSPFEAKKRSILADLAAPDYDDASPKGSLDEALLPLIHEINAIPALVTTSSCSGRVSVFVERDAAATQAKGAQWLLVSHDALDPAAPAAGGQAASSWHEAFGLAPAEDDGVNALAMADAPLVHFKFEPVILHVLAATLGDARKLLAAANAAGLRESGISSVSEGDGRGQGHGVMVALRTTGLALDSIIGIATAGPPRAIVAEPVLRLLVAVARRRFAANAERTVRLRANIASAFLANGAASTWEDGGARAARMRAEGLARRGQPGQDPAGQAGPEDGAQDEAHDSLDGLDLLDAEPEPES